MPSEEKRGNLIAVVPADGGWGLTECDDLCLFEAVRDRLVKDKCDLLSLTNRDISIVLKQETMPCVPVEKT